MHLEQPLKFIGDINYRPKMLIDFISNLYDWSSTYDAYLEGTGAVFFPFKNGSYNQFSDNANVGKIESVIIELSIPILREILNYYPTARFIKGEMYCCNPKTDQSLHIDPKVLHRFCHRIHIPLITNDQCFLQVEDNHYHLEPNKIYEFNNLLKHRSYNHGDTKRIHLIIDIMDAEIYKKFVSVDKYQLLFQNSSDDGKSLDTYFIDLIKNNCGIQTTE